MARKYELFTCPPYLASTKEGAANIRIVKGLAGIALATGLLTGALVMFETKTASAATGTSTSSTLLTATVDTNASLAPEEKLAKAKEDLTKALNLSLKKVEGLKGRLNELNFPELSREDTLKQDALKELGEYTKHYNEAKADLEKSASIEEVKELAKDVKEYRDTFYTPGMEKIVRFVLVFYNEEILGVANDRLDKIEADVKKLDKLGVIKESDFQGRLEEANSLLKESSNLQGEAKKITLSATSTGSTEESDSSSKDMVEKSLNNVKAAYNIFIELNQSVKKALGL